MQEETWQPTATPNIIRIGIPGIDQITGGIQPGDIWALAGEASSGKSLLMCRCGLGASALGLKTLFLSMIMPYNEAEQCILSMQGKVNAKHMRLGQLSHFAVRQVYEKLGEWEAQGNKDKLILLGGRINVEDVLTAIHGHKPDIVFIDGAYLLMPNGEAPSSRAERIAKVIEQLKDVAVSAELPIICSFQAERRMNGAEWYTTAGKTINRIATVVLRLSDGASQYPTFADRHDGISHKLVEIFKGQLGKVGDVLMRYDMNLTRIEQDSPI